jgi:MYXO-CTERM domain-containing protein
MTKTLALLSALTLVAITTAAAPRARAQGLESCGNIHVEAQAQCEVIPPGVECEAECTPIKVEAACEARVVAQCDGECNFTPPQNCSLDCQAGCMGECSVDPGSFECSAECEASCSGECSGKCSAAANKAECMGQCEGTCSARCDAGCEGTPPSAECDAKCEASCDTSCEVEAELDCQLDCQADAKADCVLDVEGGCKADCETMEGALFCDGQYVDHGDNLDQCVAAIEAVINAEVEGYAEGSSSCEGGSCKAEGSAGVSCAAVPGGTSSGAGVIALLGASVLALGRRRRNG